MKEWKPIKNWEEYYEVSSLGEVRNVESGKLIVGDINNFGYYRVCLYRNGKKQRFFRHRLVAEHFLPVPQHDEVFVNHKDGDKSNNTVENLEWCTQSENEKHAFKNNLKHTTNNPFVLHMKDGSTLYFNKIEDCVQYLGCSRHAVMRWLNHSRKSAKYGVVKAEFVGVKKYNRAGTINA